MSHRTAMLGHVIQREIATLIQRGKLKDPRVHELTTITGVDVTGDLSLARVYFTVLGDQAAIEETGRGLQAASGFLHRHLGKVLTVRQVPTLEFRYDPSVAQGDRIERLLAGLPELHEDAAGDAGDDAEAEADAGAEADVEAEDEDNPRDPPSGRRPGPAGDVPGGGGGVREGSGVPV